MSLFVGNLSSHVQHGELERVFRRFGRFNLELKDGYGFVVFEAYNDAERALRALQGKIICGERPSLTWARKHRPFRRFSGKESSFKDFQGNAQGPVEKGFKRRRSPEIDKGSSPEKNDRGESGDEVDRKKGFRDIEPRDDAVDDVARRQWKDQAAEELIVQGVESKDLDLLNSGRWGEPLSEGSPNHIYGEDVRDYDEASHDKGKGSKKNVQDKLHDSSSDMSPEQSSHARRSEERTKRRRKGKEAVEGSMKNVREKSHDSYSDRSPELSSRAYFNSEEQSRRRHDSLGKSQERCYNCGKIGHIMRYCRARTSFNFSRERFDGRRFQYRGLRGNGFRRLGGRFRGMEMSRRGWNRDIDASYGRRTFRGQGFISDKKVYEEVDTISRRKHSHRHQHSDSQRGSPTRERNKRRKISGKRLTSRSHKRSHKKRKSSSESASPSPSRSKSSSSSTSQSHSRSSRSKSRSSKSRYRSSSSRSVSPSRNSSRSRSLSLSSHSRSRARSSKSGRSNSKSHSHSSKSHSRSVSHSRSPQLKSESHSARRSSSSLHGNSQGSRGTSQEFGKRALNSHINKLEVETLLAGTSSSYYETTGHLPETARDTSKRLLHPVETVEMQATKKLKLDNEEGVMGAPGIYKQRSGDAKQEELISVMKGADCSKYSSREGMQEVQKESSWCGSRDSRNVIGQKSGDRGGWNNFAEHTSRNSEEVVKRLDASIAGNAEEKFSKDQRDTKWQDHRIGVSRGILAPADHLYDSAECESVTQESQNFAFNVHLTDMKGSGTRGVAECGSVQHPVAPLFGAARLWPWESILYRRLKRGPISTANYERRKEQNENFRIVDKFVRSSSGWWERVLD